MSRQGRSIPTRSSHPTLLQPPYTPEPYPSPSSFPVHAFVYYFRGKRSFSKKLSSPPLTPPTDTLSSSPFSSSVQAPPTCCRTSICRPPSPGLRPPQLPPASSRRRAGILPQPANTLRWFPFYKNQASNSCFQSFLLSFNTNLLDKVVNNSASVTQALAHSLPVTTGLWYRRSGDAAPTVVN